MKSDDIRENENQITDDRVIGTEDSSIDIQDINDELPKKRKRRKRRKNKYVYSIVGTMVIGIIAALYVIAINANTAYVTISASFSEIAEGHNPDGSPFDIYEVLSDEVLRRACVKLGNKVDTNTLKKHISVTSITTDGTFNTIQQNILDGNDTYSYYPSQYTMTYSTISDSVVGDGLLACVKAVFEELTMPSKKDILKCVAASYKECYENNYIVTNDVFNVDWSETKSLDFFNRATEMENILNKMTRYLGKLYDNDVKYTSKEGYGFGDLREEANGIIQNDIESYKSFIIQNGITYDREKLMKQFRYVINTNNDQLQRSRGEYSIMLEGISIYNPNITKVIFIPSLDSENVFYMNRTKIGIDYLTESASDASLTGDEAENNVRYYEYLTSLFGSVASNEDWMLKTAETRCDEIITKIMDFCKKAKDVNEEYIESVAYEGVEISGVTVGQGMVSTAISIIKLVVIWTSVVYVIGVSLSFLRKKRKTLKEEREDGNINS